MKRANWTESGTWIHRRADRPDLPGIPFNPMINKVVNLKTGTEPLYDFTAEDGIRHRVWEIDNADSIQTVEEAFAEIPATYIADGHHRAASAVKVGLKRREENPDYTGKEPFNYFLSVLFPDDQLMIMPYNRG